MPSPLCASWGCCCLGEIACSRSLFFVAVHIDRKKFTTMLPSLLRNTSFRPYPASPSFPLRAHPFALPWVCSSASPYLPGLPHESVISYLLLAGLIRRCRCHVTGVAVHDRGFRGAWRRGVRPLGVRERHHGPGWGLEVEIRIEAHGHSAQDGGERMVLAFAVCVGGRCIVFRPDEASGVESKLRRTDRSIGFAPITQIRIHTKSRTKPIKSKSQ